MIDTQALRNKILDDAFHGLLVSQKEFGETGDELYKRIKAEIQSNVQLKSAIRKLNDISKEEEPFVIPSNWKWVPLGGLFAHNTGKALNNSDNIGKKLSYITTSNVYWDSFVLNNLKEMYFSEAEIEKCTVRKGDMLVCEGGDIGRAAIWPFECEMRIQNHLHRLRRYSDQINTEFYYYLLRYYKQIGLIDGVGIGLQGFSSGRVHNLPVPFPPYTEQLKIVHQINLSFDLIKAIENLQNEYSHNCESLKSKLIDAAIRGKLTKQLPEDGTAEELFQQIQLEKQKLIKEGKIPKEKVLNPISTEEIPFEIPKSWKWLRVQDIATYITDYVANGSFAVLKAHTKTYNEPNYALFVRTVDLGSNFTDQCSYIDKESYDFLKKSQLFGGELILPNIGASIGKVFILPDMGMPMSLAPNSIMLKFRSSEMNRYFAYLIKSAYGNSLLVNAQGGSATAKFSKTDLRSLVFPLPPLGELKRIVSRLDKLFEICG